MARCAWLVVLTASACFRTPEPACGFVCGDDAACPDGYACGSDSRCQLPGTQNPCGDSPIDGGTDALESVSVVGSTPNDGELGVPLGTSIELQYSRVILGVDITAASLVGNGAPVTIGDSLTGQDSIVMIQPSLPLAGSTTYQLAVGANFTAPSGFPQIPFSLSFTTVADTTPPTVTTTPNNGDTNVADASAIVLVFSEVVLNVDATTFVVSTGGTPLTGTIISNDQITWQFMPGAPFPAASTIEFTLSAAITDTTGNPLAPIDYTFMTQ
jgi:Bacterial Ig-like domain